ncbi:glutathione S-transferase theta-1-like [Diceros bicornis minor]|uniref:glutathione S-transferase theta-1-like n=1 Tax=Diceros bicornis minor TaxID=77932 RepID=UPI0026EB768B|nr:glutathione S-transferase theta-1-like [Diceros bicornis minor]XP_058387910.1 glutathione S-transferase theta-1-like [Diceros bicornis minor]
MGRSSPPTHPSPRPEAELDRKPVKSPCCGRCSRPVLVGGEISDTAARSVAILLYLSCEFQTAAHWYPPELQARARVDEYLAWQHAAIQLPATNVDLCELEELLGKLTRTLQHLDRQVLAARPFLATEQVSLADLMAFRELMQPTAVGCDLCQDWPRLAVWQAHVEAVLGPELVQEAHRLVLQPRDHREAQLDPQLAQKLVQRLQERLR